jgi:hypothetical protein
LGKRRIALGRSVPYNKNCFKAKIIARHTFKKHHYIATSEAAPVCASPQQLATNVKNGMARQPARMGKIRTATQHLNGTGKMVQVGSSWSPLLMKTGLLAHLETVLAPV